MIERLDPAHTGVRVGRVVGLATAGLAVAGLLGPGSSLYGWGEPLLAVVGIDTEGLTTLGTIVSAVLAAIARYTICYTLGSLLGVVYDWFDDPSVTPLAVVVAVVGVTDALSAYLDTRSLLIAAGYLLAWLGYVPLFVRWLPDDTSETGPVRLG